MNYLVKNICCWGLILCGVIAVSSPASASGLLSVKGSKTELQIQDHSVSVSIEDGYSITTVENTFYNPSNKDLDAVYAFPVPKNGTVAGFTVWIDETEITGEVVEKQRARQLYEQEKAAGRATGLTEKKSFHRFESAVSPVRAGQTTRTQIVYMQPADIEGGVGRYVYPLEEGGADEEKLNFWQTDTAVKGNFEFDLKLRSSSPVDAMRAPAHAHASISNIDDQQWVMTINKNGMAKPSAATETATTDRETVFADLGSNPKSESTLNQDIVVYWRLRPGLPGGIELLTHREPGERRGTFMLTVDPGIDLQPISQGRDWVFVLDRSGSMSGKYQTLLDATQQTLHKLPAGDRFKIILFSNHVELLTQDWVNADQVSIARVSTALNQSQVGGGTDLYAGIHTAIKQLDADRTSSIVLVSDGVANLGKTHKTDFLTLMEQQDVRLFTAIMGNGTNRPLLESMTHVSGGFATDVSNSDDIMGVLISATEKVKYQAMHDIDLSIKGLRTSDLVPTQPSTLYRGQQLVLFGHYFGDDEAEVVLRTKISGEDKTYKSRFQFPKESVENPEVERLWAYAQIQELKNKANYLGTPLADYRSAVVDTAIEYGLVTDFTSMLVMTDQQFAQHGIEQKNKQRSNKERKAAKVRAQRAVTSNRVDQADPAFSGQSANYSSASNSGSGAVGPWSLVLLLPFLLAGLRRLLAVRTK